MLKEYALIIAIAGMAVACQTMPSAGPTNQGLQLPYEGSVSADGRAFTVINTGKGDAIAASTSGENAAAVRGRANNADDVENYGGYFHSKGRKGIAVYGAADNFDAGTNYGGKFVANGMSGIGLYSEASFPGNAINYGGQFKSQGAKGVGVLGQAFGQEGTGIFGWAMNNGDVMNYGGHFRASGKHGRGIFAESSFWGVAAVAGGEKGIAVNAEATHTGDITNYGGYFVARGKYGRGIYAWGGSDGAAAEFRGNVKIANWGTGEVIIELGLGLDYAEGFDVVDKYTVTPGMVLVIDPQSPGRLSISKTPYDKRVAGIVSGAHGVGSAVRVASEGFDHPVALAGRVYCNVAATDEAVAAGDLLTTSSVPGFAMKASDLQRSPGAILGKAMESLEKGKKGQILVLVTLQ